MNAFFSGVESLMREMVRDEIRAVLAQQEAPQQPMAEQPVSGPNRADRLLSAAEVGEILGVSPQRVYELARRRKINGFPVITLGERQYRFSRHHLTLWLENSSIGNMAENES